MPVNDHSYYIDNAPFKSDDLGVLETQLREAIYSSDVDLVRELISNGVDVNIFAWEEDSTPLGMSCEVGSLEIVDLLLKAGANPDFGVSLHPLTTAASKGNIEIVKVLIEAGADVNAVLEDDHTALADAAWCGNIKMIKLLVESGADVNYSSKSSNAIHNALANRHWEVFVYLFPYLSPESAQEVHSYALKLAQDEDNTEVVQFLNIQ
jgi:ankyrin repeat protein